MRTAISLMYLANKERRMGIRIPGNLRPSPSPNAHRANRNAMTALLVQCVIPLLSADLLDVSTISTVQEHRQCIDTATKPGTNSSFLGYDSFILVAPNLEGTRGYLAVRLLARAQVMGMTECGYLVLEGGQSTTLWDQSWTTKSAISRCETFRRVRTNFIS
jgi:hypothetical protein